jgi:WD40 repeat protein
MLAGVSDKVLWCWTRSRNWEQTGIRHAGGFAGAAFHPGGRTLAYSALPALYPRAQLPDTTDGPIGVRLYPLTAASEFDREVLLFEEGGDAQGGDVLDRLDQYHWARGLVFTPDGRTLLSRVDEDRGLFSRSQPVILHWHFTPSGDRWRVSAPVPGRTVAERGTALVGTTCLALAAKYAVHVCPLDPAATAPLLTPDVSQLHPLAVSATAELVAGWDNMRLHVWHLRRPTPVSAWRVAPQTLFSLAFAPDGRALAAGYSDGSVTFWDPHTGGRMSAFNFGVGAVQSLAYAPDGLTLAIAGNRGLVVVDVG